MADELTRLPPGDEVGIMAMNIGEDEKRVWLTRFTNDRAQLDAALARVPRFVEGNEENVPDKNEVRQSAQTIQPESNGSLTVNVGSDQKESRNKDTRKDTTVPNQPNPEDIVETETIKGKNGAVVTRTVLNDGSVNLKRVNSSGNVHDRVGGRI